MPVSLTAHPPDRHPHPVRCVSLTHTGEGTTVSASLTVYAAVRASCHP